MFYQKYKNSAKCIVVSFLFLIIVGLMFSTYVSIEASANDEYSSDTITVRGKVIDTGGDSVRSAQIQYTDGYSQHDIYYAALDGGFMFSMPATSNCSLIFYQDGYKPKTINYTMEYLQDHMPVMNVGNIVLDTLDYIKISGYVYDVFNSDPVEGASVRFYLTDKNEACRAVTNVDGSFSLTVPKGYNGIWQINKDNFNLYESIPISYSQDTTNVDFNIRQLNQYVVSFESNGGSTIKRQIVEGGQIATKPSDPILDNFVFDGWYLDNNTFQKPYDFSQPVNEDITLYAKWNQVLKSTDGTPAKTSDNLIDAEILLLVIALGSALYCLVCYIKITNRRKKESCINV